MKRTWAKNDKAMDFEDLTAPVVNAIRQAFKLERKDRDKDLKWRGPPLPKSLGPRHFPFDEKLTAKRLRQDEDEQNRDALEVLVGVAVQLGIEQGRRIFKAEWEYESNLESLLEDVRAALNKPKKKSSKKKKAAPKPKPFDIDEVTRNHINSYKKTAKKRAKKKAKKK